MSKARTSPNSPQWCIWTDPIGCTWEFRYIVTQRPDEGPEYMEYREYKGHPTWFRWEDDEEGEPPKEVEEFFHGKLIG